LIGARADYTGLKTNLFSLILDSDAFPMTGNFDQQAIGDRLSGQAGAGGAEGHGDSPTLAELEELGDFQFVFRQYDGFGDQAIEAGVGREGDQIDGTNENAVGGDLFRKKRPDFRRRMRGRG
jgi:hypothetical protein